ncbi:large ribosomal subunit protein mL41 [Planococcus citri]|uniref:large ribosomal subunit protein mL41 n=1 Tax=Planococcus citri TaxID=170843 RepID=UPI0031F8BFA5
MMFSNVLRNHSSCISIQFSRSFSSSSVNYGMRSFNKFVLVRRGTKKEKKQQEENPDPELQYTNYGHREPGYVLGGKRYVPPESIPELIVPDLTDCPFKPYVSYRAVTRDEPEFTAKDLFEVTYCRKMYDDFKANKLDEDGNALEPNDAEKLTAQEAWANARKCNNDLMNTINTYVPRYIRENRD